MAAAPPPVLTPQPKRTRADWERIERELREAQENKVAIRDRNIPPYFESDMGKAFLRTQVPFTWLLFLCIAIIRSFTLSLVKILKFKI